MKYYQSIRMSSVLDLCRKLRYRSIKFKSVLFIGAVILFLFLEYFGAFTHFFEKDYFEKFEYPLEGDIKKYVEELKNGQVPSAKPINIYNFTYVSNCMTKCKMSSEETLRLVYLVKSAMPNFDRRHAIRNSWGYEKRFSDVPIRTVFLLGISGEDNTELQAKIDQEQMTYKDIVQTKFIDSYYNNTYKTMMGFKWIMDFCPNSKFYMFSDDDMYVSTKNVLRFLRNPSQYPEYLLRKNVSENQGLGHKQLESFEPQHSSNQLSVPRNMLGSKSRQSLVFDFELPDDVILFTGFVVFSSPLRNRDSKWYITLSEYPFHKWPPYVPAGAYILSRHVLVDMYYASFFVKHFKFDDIYIAILAKKLGIEPLNNNEFYVHKKAYSFSQYKYVIASHGYDNPHELLDIWNHMRSSGFA